MPGYTAEYGDIVKISSNEWKCDILNRKDSTTISQEKVMIKLQKEWVPVEGESVELVLIDKDTGEAIEGMAPIKITARDRMWDNKPFSVITEAFLYSQSTGKKHNFGVKETKINDIPIDQVTDYTHVVEQVGQLGKCFKVINTKTQVTPATKDIAVEKVWKGQVANQAILALYDVENPDENNQPIKVLNLPTATGSWSGVFEDLPTHYDSGDVINYSVKEVIRNQADTAYIIVQNGMIFPIFDRKYRLVESKEGEKLIFTNIEHFDLTMKKAWEGYTTTANDTVQFTLYKKGTGDTEFTKVEDFLIDNTEDWTKTKLDLPAWSDGKDLTYRLMETEINGETVILRQDFAYPYKHKNFEITTSLLDFNTKAEVTITNKATQVPIPSEDTITLEVTKLWGATPENYKKEVEIALYQKEGSNPLIPTDKKVTLSTGNNWKDSFVDLPKKNTNGGDITYYVFETKIGGEEVRFTPAEDLMSYSFGDYRIQIVGNGTGQVTVNNSYVQETLQPYIPPYTPGEEIDDDDVPEGTPDGNKDKDKEKDKDKDKDKGKEEEKQKLLTGTDSEDSKPKDDTKDQTSKDTHKDKVEDKETVKGQDNTIEDAKIPQGKTDLPKTGGLPVGAFLLIGIGLIGSGFVVKKRNRK